MPLVPGICTQCGSKIEVDPDKEAAVCSFCGTPFITEKVINNYNTTNVTNIGSLHADVVNVSDEKSIENRVKAAETFMSLGRIDSAREIFNELTDECPYDHRGWWGRILVATHNFEERPESVWVVDSLKEWYSFAIKVANDEQEKKRMEEKFLPYISEVDKLICDYKQRMADIEAQLEDIKARTEQIAGERKPVSEPDSPGIFTWLMILIPKIGWILFIIRWVYYFIVWWKYDNISQKNGEIQKEESRLYALDQELRAEYSKTEIKLFDLRKLKEEEEDEDEEEDE